MNIPDGYQSPKINKTPIPKFNKARLKFPNRVIVLLPMKSNKYMVPSAPKNVKALIIIGTSGARPGRTVPTMILEAVTIALTPDICCISGI